MSNATSVRRGVRPRRWPCACPPAHSTDTTPHSSPAESCHHLPGHEPGRAVALGDRDAGLTQPVVPIHQFGERDILPGGILAQRQAAGGRVMREISASGRVPGITTCSKPPINLEGSVSRNHNRWDWWSGYRSPLDRFLSGQKIIIKNSTTTANPIRKMIPIVLPRNFNIALLL